MIKKMSLADWQQQRSDTDTVPKTTRDVLSAHQDVKTELVYSTEHGRITPTTATPIMGERYADGALRIKRETKGRGGKTVLIITGLTGTPAELTALCTELKKRCACGGAVKEGHIEIQADKREFVAELLQQKGYKVKQAGG